MRTRRGSVFVVSLAILAGLVTIMAFAASAQRLAMRSRANRIDHARAAIAAEAGFQHALTVLAGLDPGITTLSDDWVAYGQNGAEEMELAADANVSFRAQILDASSRLDLNSATEADLIRMNLTEEQAQSLLDWRSGGQQARSLGAKDDYYNSLPTPYNAKLRRLDSIDELLQVKGFTPTDLYETADSTTSTIVTTTGSEERPLVDKVEVGSAGRAISPAGQPLVNINTATAQQLQQLGINGVLLGNIMTRRSRATFTSLTDLLSVPAMNRNVAATAIDRLTVNTDTVRLGRVNLNTASKEVLEALPGMTPDIADQIISRQADGIRSVSDLLAIPGITLQALQQLADRICLNSSTFLVRVIGKAGQTTVALEAMVATDGSAPRIVRISRPPFSDMESRWLWDEPSTTTTLGGGA